MKNKMLQKIVSVLKILSNLRFLPCKAGEQSKGNSQFEAEVQWERPLTAKNR